MRKSLAMALVGLAWCSQAASAELTDAEKALLRKIGTDPSKRAAAVGILGAAPSAVVEVKKPKARAVVATKEKPIFPDVFGDLVRRQEYDPDLIPLQVQGSRIQRMPRVQVHSAAGLEGYRFPRMPQGCGGCRRRRDRLRG
jgi:hypothetical protein